MNNYNFKIVNNRNFYGIKDELNNINILTKKYYNNNVSIYNCLKYNQFTKDLSQARSLKCLDILSLTAIL